MFYAGRLLGTLLYVGLSRYGTVSMAAISY